MANEKEEPFRLPAPKFGDETQKSLDSFTKLRNPHFSTPSGMLLPRDKQPPPMFGPRGSTVPPRFLNRNQSQQQQQHSPRGGHYQQRFRGGPPRGNYHHNNYNHHQNNGLEKDVIPALLEVNWAFWCEACDVNCKTEEELQQHVGGHRNCEVEGCRYVGHPGVMKRHWRLAHDEKKLLEKAKLDTKQSPADIEKWRAERRLRYPTKENVERRQQAQEERFKRGERIEEDKRRFPNRNQGDERENRGRDSRGGTRGHPPRPRFKPARKQTVVEEKEDSSDDDADETRVGFKGTASLENYKEKPKTSLSLLCGYGGSDSEEELSSATTEEDEPEPEPKPVAETEVVPKSSSAETLEATSGETIGTNEASLSDGEIVDEEEEATVNPESIHISEEEDEEDKQQKDPQKLVSESEKPVDHKKSEEDGSSEQPESSESKSKRRNRSRKRRNGSNQPEQAVPAKMTRIEKPLLDYSKLRRARQNTMLEKLLEPDIRHERNVLLQCVRFVVENKFFGIGQPKPETVPEQQEQELQDKVDE